MKRVLVFALALILCPTGVWADPHSDCNQIEAPDRAIRGCTMIIERGEKEIRQNRAGAYTNRGIVYFIKGEVDRAIADYDNAIAIDSNFAGAYFNRGAPTTRL